MNPSTAASPRRFDIDWLRSLSMLAVFLFHCARFFDEYPWHVKSSVVDPGLDALVGFLVVWIMPIFFVLAGQGSFFSLVFRSGRQFLAARTKRLAVPFIMGVFILIPPQVYLERLHWGDFDGSFLQFFPHYFDGWYAFGGNFAWMGLHLWFLEVLFIFSVIMLPVFLWLRRQRAREALGWLAGLLDKPGGIFLLGVPMAIIEVSLDPEGLGMREFGGWSVIQYLCLFFYGFIIASNAGFQKNIEKHRSTALGLGLILHLNALFLPHTAGYAVHMIIRAFNCWCWLVAILGYGGRYLHIHKPVLDHANEAVLPFYVLHQTVILILGFWIIRLSMPSLLQYSLICVLSFTTIILLYLSIVRSNNLSRFLFGMKSRA
jgi:hypothetical protein